MKAKSKYYIYIISYVYRVKTALIQYWFSILKEARKSLGKKQHSAISSRRLITAAHKYYVFFTFDFKRE